MQYSQLLSYILCSASLVLILLILIAGSHENVLEDYYFLKTNTASLSIPSKLSNSTFLKDLSNLTGNDLVGQSASAASLGLAKSYTVSLLTACAEDASCTSPHFGFHFNPISDLKLDTTAIQGSFTSNFLHSLSTYATVSRFLAVAYVLALVFTFATPIFILSSSRFPRAAVLGTATSILAFAFLLAASGAAIGIFEKVKGTFNSKLEPVGITTSLGDRLFVLGWVATVLSLGTSVLLCVSARRVSNEGRRNTRGVDGLLDKAAEDGAARPALKTSGFLHRLPTFRRHNYAQIEKQGQQAAITGKVYDAGDRDVLMKRGFGGGDSEEEEEEHQLEGEQTRGIQLQPMGLGARRDLDTAYEPYRSHIGEAV